MDSRLADISASLQGTLAELLGIQFIEATADRVVARLPIRDDLRTVGGSLHGGTLMALADTVGAAATVLNLAAGAGNDLDRAAKVMVGLLVGVLQKAVGEHALIEHVNAHGYEVRARTGRFLLETDQASVIRGRQDTESVRLFERYLVHP